MKAALFAQTGIAAAIQRFEASAQRTAQVADPEAAVDLAREVTEQISAQHALAANVRVLKAADEMTGKLLDILT